MCRTMAVKWVCLTSCLAIMFIFGLIFLGKVWTLLFPLVVGLSILNITDTNNPSNHRRSLCKNSWDNTLVCRSLEGIYSIYRRKMEQILVVYIKEITNPFRKIHTNMSSVWGHFDQKTQELKESDHVLISFLVRVQQKRCHMDANYTPAKTAYK